MSSICLQICLSLWFQTLMSNFCHLEAALMTRFLQGFRASPVWRVCASAQTSADSQTTWNPCRICLRFIQAPIEHLWKPVWFVRSNWCWTGRTELDVWSLFDPHYSMEETFTRLKTNLGLIPERKASLCSDQTAGIWTVASVSASTLWWGWFLLSYIHGTK